MGQSFLAQFEPPPKPLQRNISQGMSYNNLVDAGQNPSYVKLINHSVGSSQEHLWTDAGVGSENPAEIYTNDF